MILSGSEDGHLYGWDLNSQRLKIKMPVVSEAEFESMKDHLCPYNMNQRQNAGEMNYRY